MKPYADDIEFDFDNDVFNVFVDVDAGSRKEYAFQYSVNEDANGQVLVRLESYDGGLHYDSECYQYNVNSIGDDEFGQASDNIRREATSALKESAESAVQNHLDAK